MKKKKTALSGKKSPAERKKIIGKVLQTFERLAIGLIKIWIAQRSFIVRASDIEGLALDELKLGLGIKDE